jgi:aspartate-semialdehyde dehydrogenase
MEPYRVGVLGATGMVGQRLVRLLADHPWFRLTALAASARSAGKPYGEAVSWQLSGGVPAGASDRAVRECDPASHGDCDLVFSGLDSATARDVEPAFAAAGLAVVSNASAFRMADDVPLLIPEVNADHVSLISAQRAKGTPGFVVTNPNCSVTGLAVALAPLHERFVIRRAVVATLQAVSGAGMEGPGAIELLDNVIPFIRGEEEKVEVELGKLLGVVDGDRVRPAEIAVSAHCHRVGTLDGHLEAVSLELARPAAVEEVIRTLREFRGAARDDGLPSAPASTIVVRDEPDRPQPRLDRDEGHGMSVVVGRVRPCPVLGVKLELLSHNTVRGAAGAAILNAELLAARELLPRRAR